MSKLKQISFGVIAIITSFVGSGLLSTSAGAATHQVLNRFDSEYRINVYTGRGCTGTHKILAPNNYTSGISYRVNAYSRYAVNGTASGYIAPNKCITAPSNSDWMTVLNYSNL